MLAEPDNVGFWPDILFVTDISNTSQQLYPLLFPFLLGKKRGETFFHYGVNSANKPGRSSWRV